MPTPDEWLIFLSTAVIFAVTPGPAMLYVIARSLHGGRRDGTLSAIGNGIGTVGHVLAAAVGLSALLAASPVAFTVVKFIGAGYLAVLGFHAIRNRRIGDTGTQRPDGYSRSPLMQGVIVESLNPKTALYFMALLPHFVHPERGAPSAVFGLLGLVVVVIVVTTDMVVALTASRLHTRLSESVRWQERQRAGSGVLMIGLGTFVAFT